MSIVDHNKTMLSAALALAASGNAILPIRPREKTPLIKGGCNAASSDPLRVQEWWGKLYTGCNIAIATGPSSGCFVIDIDGAEAEEALTALQQLYGQLPQTVTAYSGRPGGRHLYYSHPGSRVPSRANVLGHHIDVRGDGGYIVVPPSIHPNGQRYRWDDNTPTEYATAPPWLIDLVTGRRPDSPPASPKSGSTIGDAKSEVISSGRHDSLRALACNLRRSGANQDEVRAALLARLNRLTRPPKPTEIEDLITFAWQRVPEPVPGTVERPVVMLGPDEHRVLDEVRTLLAEYMRSTRRHFVRNGQFVALDEVL